MFHIELSEVTKLYGGVKAVDGVSLTVEPGQLHCLVGPNGSGKTTLFRLLAGLTSPTEGEVRTASTSLGVGFQEPRFYPGFSVTENLAIFGDLVGAAPDWRASLESQLGLTRISHRKAGELSGGEATKLDLALALLGHPQVVLLDEPLDDLDDLTRGRVVDLLAEYRGDGRTVLVATHRLRAFEGHLDRLTLVKDGALHFDRAGDELAAAVGERSAADYYLTVLGDPGAQSREESQGEG